MKHDITVGLVELDVPQDNGNLPNTWVLVCMMMEKLVANKPLQIEDGVETTCVIHGRQAIQMSLST